MYYITKYALTAGIIEVSDEEFCVAESGGLYGKRKCDTISSMYHGNDWHNTIEHARERAEQMRAAKIKSLKKAMAKLEALTFDGASNEPA